MTSSLHGQILGKQLLLENTPFWLQTIINIFEHKHYLLQIHCHNSVLYCKYQTKHIEKY